LALLSALFKENGSNPGEMQCADEIDLKRFQVAWRVFHSVHVEVRIEPIASFEYTGAGYCMVYMTMLVEGCLEEIVDVFVSGHVALHYRNRRILVGKGTGGLMVNISNDYVCTVVCKNSDCGRSNASSTSYRLR
jgi:hypothetical protein